MFGIQGNYSYYNMLYSSMTYGRGNGLFGAQSSKNQSSFGGLSAFGGMMTDYSQVNNSMLTKSLYSMLSRQKQSLDNRYQYSQDSSAFQKQASATFSALKSSAGSLKSYSSTSVFHPTGYGSSESSVASVKSGTLSSDSSKTPVSLTVKQTAQAQTTQTDALASNGYAFTSKSGSLTLTNKEDPLKTKTFRFDFSHNTTNKDALDKIASSVNNSNMGITASVVSKDGKSTLQFTSDKTGTDSAFTASFSDSLTGAGGLSTKEEARNAIYSVNGEEEKTSQSNDIQLEDGKLQVTLKGEGTTTFAKNVRDDSKIVDTVKQFAQDYNKALSFLNDNADKSSALENLAYSFGSSRLFSSKLSEIGINTDKTGRLDINEKKLSQALKDSPNKVEQLISGPLGIANNAYSKASSAVTNVRNLYPSYEQQAGNSSMLYNRNMNYMYPYISGMFFNMFA